ncbi:hypothetical protein Cs7R123_03070 [Catellatospora sp. TT07R-123]|uniref:hypothetical protein n=1 Tax=Catellatospora sp. TT07R-123 TaxID=2733863 RepID=UPI001B0D9F94|nr:hypothetical protein [Catellatospora sp. TT07R-123]GHJ42965.1 hypothetical protein Cs7R123_03070 [Catellatospora sp. TT07R-123]
MADVHVSLDGDELGPVERKLQEPLEDQLSSALDRAAQVVAEQYAGQSEQEVVRLLREEAGAALHPDVAAGFQPDEQGLRAVARAVIARATA